MEQTSEISLEIERFLASLGRERQFSENTIAAYRNDLTQFMEYGLRPPAEDQLTPLSSWSELTADHLNRYLGFMSQRQYAPSTVARKTAALKSFSQHLAQAGLVRTDPSRELTPPRVNRFVPKAISVDEVERLMALPRSAVESGTPEAYRDLAMLETLYASGMRVSELVALNVADVDYAGQRITCPGKSGRRRVVPIRPVAVSALTAYVERGRPQFVPDGESALFVNHRGGRLTRQGFWLILKSYSEKAGVEQITPHTLRHSFAAHALNGGADLRDVQQLLGHVSMSTTQVYRRIAAAENDAATSSGTDSKRNSKQQ
ncbi:tyrosine recombinase [soil metagenome]